jgi:hypothetical protein
MARSTRGRKGFRLARRLLSPVQEGVGLLRNTGEAGLRAGKKVFGAGLGFAGNVVRSTGRRVNGAVGGLFGRGKKGSTRRKTRRNRSSRSQRR